jgi:hypothetical protein
MPAALKFFNGEQHMKLLKMTILAGILLASTHLTFASDYKDFLRDLAAPYASYRQSLVLTSNKDNLGKAQQAIEQFTQAWEGLALRYAGDPPAPFAGIADFSGKIKRPVAVGKEALAMMKEEQVTRAHAALEEVRYLMWDMRVRAHINSVADKANDFHEAMEVVLDQAAVTKTPEELTHLWSRYGAWLAIKWEDNALADDLGPIRAEFDVALLDGRKAVASYLDALRAGNAESAKKLAGGVKNAYKKIWAIDPK